MKNVLRVMWREDDGMLSFEWVLLLTLLAIGVTAGIAGARDAIIDELGDVAGAAISIDQSYTIPAVEIDDVLFAPDQQFEDTPPPQFETCSRTDAPSGQPALVEGDS